MSYNIFSKHLFGRNEKRMMISLFPKQKISSTKVISKVLTFKLTKRARLQKAKQDRKKVKLEQTNEQKEEL